MSQLVNHIRGLLGCIVLIPLSGQLVAQDRTALPEKLAVAEAVQIAMQKNPTLLREKQGLAIADANVTQAKLRPNPDFDLNSESYLLFESNPGSFIDNQELSFRAAQAIETAGKRGKRPGWHGKRDWRLHPMWTTSRGN